MKKLYCIICVFSALITVVYLSSAEKFTYVIKDKITQIGHVQIKQAKARFARAEVEAL
ncbi:hypothetical protein M8994_18545 [Brucella sp. 21LCYQ03]|nr:hypothetical protein [Brucella sp. 21LCYQ03]